MRAFTIIIFLAPILLMAQPFQGQKFVGGSLSFKMQSSGDNFKSTFFSIDPVIGKMISNRFAVGAILGMEQRRSVRERTIIINFLTREEVMEDQIITNTGLKIEPFVSWYFRITGKWHFNLFAGLGAKATRFKIDHYRRATSMSEEYQVSLSILPSVYYFLSDKIALNASFGGLEYRRQFEEGQDSFNDLRLSLSSNFAIGVRYFWGKSLEKD